MLGRAKPLGTQETQHKAAEKEKECSRCPHARCLPPSQQEKKHKKKKSRRPTKKKRNQNDMNPRDQDSRIRLGKLSHTNFPRNQKGWIIDMTPGYIMTLPTINSGALKISYKQRLASSPVSLWVFGHFRIIAS